MSITIKEGERYDPRRAERQRSVSLRKVKERWVEIRCECGHEETGWERTEPEPLIPVPTPFPLIDVWICPSCRAMMEPKKRVERRRADLPNCLSNWEPFMLENAGHEPVLIESREHYRRVLTERGIHNMHGVGALQRSGQDLWGRQERG